MIKPGTREVHIVGGHHPDWPFEYFERMIEAIHAARPETQIKAFTAAEIDYFWRRWKIEPREALTRLKAAGLHSMPGGGAEIFSPRLREAAHFTGKADADRWLEIHGIAHALGSSPTPPCSTATSRRMEERVDHLLRLREQQDETGGFLTFIPLAYQTGDHQAGAAPDAAADDLRTIAVSRLLLDNFPHIEAYWVMIGEATASLALHFGAADVNGTLDDEKIAHMAQARRARPASHRADPPDRARRGQDAGGARRALQRGQGVELTVLRVGRIPYLNGEPFFHRLTGVDRRVDLIPRPARGSRWPRGELDAGPLSLMDYVRLESRLAPLPYGIGCPTGARSVLVFSDRPLSGLGGARVGDHGRDLHVGGARCGSCSRCATRSSPRRGWARRSRATRCC